MVDDGARWLRLGELIRHRRTVLKLSSRAAAARGDISRSTWVSAETADRQLSERLWSSVEDVLGWAQGSIATVLQGGDPTVVAAPRSGTSGLADEVERIQKMTSIPAKDRLRMIRALVDLYEQSGVDGAAQ